MKILFVNGSPNKKGNTAQLAAALLEGKEYETLNLVDYRINVYGQEKEPATYRLAKMNLALRGISHNLGGESDSTFAHDLHKGLFFDYIMANLLSVIDVGTLGSTEVDQIPLSA